MIGFGVLLAQAVLLVSFWGLAYFLLQDRWHATDPRNPEEEPGPDLDAEREDLVSDLEQNVSTIRLRFQTSDVGEPLVARERQTLLSQGIAENRTAAQNDVESPGDSWLCSGRPFWFAAFQLTLGAPLSWPLAMALCFWLPPFAGAVLAALTTQVGATVLLGLFSWVTVQERTRLGVRRFGRQTNGFLHPGLHFILPLIEEGDVVPLQNLVWGPQQTDLSSELRIGGSLGGSSNPEPGMFVVPLGGRWNVSLHVKIVIAFRGSKDAWYDALYRYRTPNEIGEQIAAVVDTILFTRSRQVYAQVHERVRQQLVHENVERRQRAAAMGVEPDLLSEEPEDDPRSSVTMLVEFLNAIPEIAGAVLLALHELGTERLGGIIPKSVVISTVDPEEAYQDLLRSVDQAKVERYRQQLEGMAVASRLGEVHRYLERITDPEQRNFLLEMVGLEVQRRFADAGAQSSVLESLIGAFLAQKSQDITKRRE